MMSGRQLQELTDGMTAQYKNKQIRAAEVVITLKAMQLAHLIAAPTVQTVSEEIITDTGELEKALAETILFLRHNKKGLNQLVRLAKKHYG